MFNPNAGLAVAGRLRAAACGLLLLSPLALLGQGLPAVVQAEGGTRGADFSTLSQSGVTYVSVATPLVAAGNPGTAARVISYTVTFPAAGTYDLYARFRVGPAAGNDDSLFYATGFGAKSPTSDSDWIIANNLWNVGFTVSTDVVTGAGTVGTGVWKWLKLSAFNGGETPVQFTVPAGALTQTFQIGAREDGLDLDKLVFGPAGLFFKVSDLDSGLAGSSTPPPPPYTPPGPPIATGLAKFLGCEYGPDSIQNFTAYWNQITPGNAGKWGSVEATRNVMNWTDLDAAYSVAKARGFPFRMHNLIWGNQQPTWIETLSAADQLAEINQWFAAVAARYPDIDFIDVVNEPLHAPPNSIGHGNYINALGGTGATGWDWVITAFRLARQYFPRAKLGLNDYSVTNSGGSAQSYVALINLLKAQGLIDTIGIQEHAFETTVPAATTAANLNTIAATGLPIYITEFDLDGSTDAAQLASYQQLFPVFWEHPSVKGVTLWGYLPGMWRTDQVAYLAYSNGAERPAFVWLKSYVTDHAPVVAAQALAVTMGAANGFPIGAGQATDADTGTVFQNWKITGGSGVGLFAINASTGVITVTNSGLLGGAGATSYTLTLTVGDGFTTSPAGTVTVSVLQTFSSWASAAGLTGAAAAPDADPNRTGVNNLLAYALGRPAGAAAGTPLFTSALESGNLVCRYNRPKAVTGVSYLFEISADLVNWTPVATAPVVESSTATLDTLRVTMPANTARLFMRLRVTQP